MKWQPFSIRFRQLFASGYRFLDQCGALMIEAEEKFNFLPTELKVTGAQLTIPESGIRASVDALALEIFQETPIEEDFFLKISTGLAALAQKHFQPKIENRLFEVKFLLPMNTEADAEGAMLRFRDEVPGELSEAFAMPLQSRKIEASFKSGSQRLNLTLQPVSFETVRQNRHNPVLQATPTQISRAARLTAQVDRMPRYAPYAIFLEMSLVEEMPPLSGEENLLKVLMQKAEKAKALYHL